MQFLLAGVIGLVSGITSAMFGVGGGLVMVPAMMGLMKMDIKVAVGTSLAVIIPTALMGTYKHNNSGYVDWKVAGMLAPMAILGSYFAANWLKEIDSAGLKRLFGGFIIMVGIRLAFFK